MIKPVITRGVGALTPEAWQRIVAAVTDYEKNKNAPVTKDRSINEGGSYILARITGNAVMTTGRWRYAWERVSLTGGFVNIVTVTTSAQYQSTMTAASSTPDTQTKAVGCAININETGNTTTLQGGYVINAATNTIQNTDGTSTTFSIGAVPAGTVVRIDFIRHVGGSGRLQPCFSFCNPVVGACAVNANFGYGVYPSEPQ